MDHDFINIHELRSEKTGLNDILEFLCKKTFKKHKKLRNLTCLYIALKSIQVDSQLKLENISDETSLISCNTLPWQLLYLSNCQNFKSMVCHFKIMQTLSKNESVSTSLRISLHTC